MGKCKGTGPDQHSSNEYQNSKIQEIEIAIQEILGDEFGGVYTDVDALQKEINDRRASLSQLKLDKAKIKRTKAPLKKYISTGGAIDEIRAIDKAIRQAKKDIRKIDKTLRHTKSRRKVALQITDLLHKWLLEAARARNWDMDVERTVKALKSFLSDKTGMFGNLNKLSLMDLNVRYRQLLKWYESSKKGEMPITGKLSKKKGGYGFSIKGIIKSFYYTMANPVKAILMNDPTLGGTELLREIHDILPRKSERKVAFKNVWYGIMKNLTDLVYNLNIIYTPPGKAAPVNPNDMTDEEQTLNMENINELRTDIMDGRTKYIKVGSIADLLKGSTVGKNKHFEKYNKIVEYANNSGFNVSKDIHEYKVGDDTFYYVTIKEVDANGVETNYAYPVPHYLDKNGRTKFYYPTTKGGKVNGNFIKAINKKDDNNKLSWELSRYMKDGFYRAQNEGIFNGRNRFQDEIVTKGYIDYQLMEGLDLNHPLFKETVVNPGSKKSLRVTSLWRAIRDSRKLLKEIHDDFQETGKLTLKRINTVISKYPELRKLIAKRGLDADEDISDTMKDILDLIDYSNALYLNDNGEIETENINSGIKGNYYPTQFHLPDAFSDKVKAIISMTSSLQSLKERVVQLERQRKNALDPSDIKGITTALIRANEKILEIEGQDILNQETGEIERIPGLIEIFKAQTDHMLGLIDKEEVPKVPTQLQIPYAKHRSLYTNRTLDLTNPNQTEGGRRTDPKVMGEYIDLAYETLLNNELLAALLETVPNVDLNVLSYLIEEVKTAMGSKHVKSGIMNLDYSNDRIKGILDKVNIWPLRSIPIEQLYAKAVNLSTYATGALLTIGTNLQNRMQSTFSTVAEIGSEVEGRVSWIIDNDPELAREIAERAGVLDTVNTLADILLGGFQSQIDMADGFHSAKNILLLAGSKAPFIKNATAIRKMFIKMIRTKEGSNAKIAVGEINALLDGTWELIHGIAEGTITKEKLNELINLFSRVGKKEWIQNYAAWGLSAFGIPDTITDIRSAKPYVTLVAGEEEMRIIMAVRGAVMYSDFVADESERGDYFSEGALLAAKSVVSNSMFMFSLQYFPKMFRGAAGILTMKFKNYWVMQTKRELELINNFRMGLKGMSREQRVQEYSKLFIAHPSAPMFGLQRLMGYDADEVNSFNPKMFGYIPFLPTLVGLMNGFTGLNYGGTKYLDRWDPNAGADRATEQLRGLLWSRWMASLWTIGIIAMIPGARSFQRYLVRRSHINMHTLGRGAESPLASLILRGVRLFLGALVIGRVSEDDDEDMTQLQRIFFPIYISMMVDAFKHGDPFRATRLLGQWTSDVGSYTWERLFGDK